MIWSTAQARKRLPIVASANCNSTCSGVSMTRVSSIISFHWAYHFIGHIISLGISFHWAYHFIGHIISLGISFHWAAGFSGPAGSVFFSGAGEEQQGQLQVFFS